MNRENPTPRDEHYQFIDEQRQAIDEIAEQIKKSTSTKEGSTMSRESQLKEAVKKGIEKGASEQMDKKADLATLALVGSGPAIAASRAPEGYGIESAFRAADKKLTTSIPGIAAGGGLGFAAGGPPGAAFGALGGGAAGNLYAGIKAPKEVMDNVGPVEKTVNKATRSPLALYGARRGDQLLGNLKSKGGDIAESVKKIVSKIT